MINMFINATTFLSLNTYFTNENFSRNNETFNTAEPLSRSNDMELINQFFTYLSYLGNSENKTDAPSLQNYLADNCIIKSNNEIISQGIEEFHNYIVRMQQKYTTVSYSNFIENPIICGNKVVLHFHVNCLTRTGVQRYLNAIAILTIEKDRISIWEEVFQEIQN